MRRRRRKRLSDELVLYLFILLVVVFVFFNAQNSRRNHNNLRIETPAPTQRPTPEAFPSRDFKLQMFDQHKDISIRGLMSSGTNWLRHLVKTNCELTSSLDFESNLGWKHNLLDQFDIQRILSNDNHKMVLLVRDAMIWTSAMRKMAFLKNEVGMELFRNKNKNMETFITTPLIKKCESHSVGWYYKICQDLQNNILVEKNILTWRTNLYRQVLQLTIDYPDKFYIVKYEDLVDDFHETWSKLLDFMPMKCSSEPTNTDRYVKYAKKHAKKFDMKEYYKKACHEYGNNQHAFQVLMENIDLDLEYKLGYEYVSNKKYCFD
jgi:hypothetical protein